MCKISLPIIVYDDDDDDDDDDGDGRVLSFLELWHNMLPFVVLASSCDVRCSSLFMVMVTMASTIFFVHRCVREARGADYT